MTNMPSEFVNQLRSLPDREKTIYTRLAIMGDDVSNVADDHGITNEQVEQIRTEVEKRLGLTT